MKKIIALAVTLLLSVSAYAAQFNQDEHYKVLDVTASSSPLVTELFSFYCPHCHSFEPMIQELKRQLPDNAKLQKVHVSFMGGPMGMSMSKAYATSIVLKIEDKMTPILFDRIHNMRKAPKDDAELRQIFLDHGVDAKAFDSAFNGFAVDSMVRRFDKQFENSGLRGVPALIVNNKYLVKTESLESVEQYFELVNFLLKK
ncbi:thiol:disulfide interchange protein DsbA/DsbL [Vibrio tapetis subsp. quintayensis]|uniref:thiol:disulfide interchange protein DsbA/DsbL n=1 Tax=Vibrio tapetis TaxID=52443 RepID=UPI0025B5EE57|nr:thiol:disulfide interchange protein DsbA/DsbL [Vibrio tapetis]MDN3679326.1 thiol:disulfide interchange protein DsbA/DsbL [Vibrio tapetis subsp. quintayensis]